MEVPMFVMYIVLLVLPTALLFKRRRELAANPHANTFRIVLACMAVAFLLGGLAVRNESALWTTLMSLEAAATAALAMLVQPARLAKVRIRNRK